MKVADFFIKTSQTISVHCHKNMLLYHVNRYFYAHKINIFLNYLNIVIEWRYRISDKEISVMDNIWVSLLVSIETDRSRSEVILI